MSPRTLTAIAEYSQTNTLLRRYVPGAAADETLVWLEGAGTTDRRWLVTDARGSVIAITNASGAVTNINKYDAYGTPAAGNVGRFQFTGQMWIPEIGLHYYKARFYNSALGRFMQTDPIGLADGMNLYAYVGNDPVNSTDPSGLVQEVLVTAKKKNEGPGGFSGGLFGGGASSAPGERGERQGEVETIEVVEKKDPLPSLSSLGGGVPRPHDDTEPCESEASSDLRNFLWGVGDVALFGFGDELRESLGVAPSI